jgi:hypothetical protein
VVSGKLLSFDGNKQLLLALSNVEQELSGRLFGRASDFPALRCSFMAAHSATPKGWSGPRARLAGVNL